MNENVMLDECALKMHCAAEQRTFDICAAFESLISVILLNKKFRSMLKHALAAFISYKVLQYLAW